ncbi:MAG: hypothetical protein HQ478_05985 [Chloroflexi bacterium]|nr:hypothetical protein [Chloroflexota bacterium]
MVSADLQRRVNGSEPALKNVGYALMLVGMMIIVAAFVIGIALGLSTADLFENSKSVRDSAAVGDSILSQQGTIAATAAWLTPFKFIGLSSFLGGIGIMLLVIINSLKLRGEAMLQSLPIILGIDQKSAE